jgi:hypothetical protein
MTRIGLFRGNTGMAVEFDETEAGDRVIVELDDHAVKVPVGILLEVLDAAGLSVETSA